MGEPGDDGGSHIELRFDGVDQNADVWLNGKHLGLHPDGHTSFAHDLTPHLDPAGPNVLAVRVDNSGRNSGRNSRWYAGSGIHRRTWLTVTGPVRVLIGRTTLRTVGAPAALRLVSDVRALNAGRDDLAHVLVEVVDRHGRLVPDATRKVIFEVDGAGELAGVGNGNPHNVDSFQRPARTTWHGEALAISARRRDRAASLSPRGPPACARRPSRHRSDADARVGAGRPRFDRPRGAGPTRTGHTWRTEPVTRGEPARPPGPPP